MTSIRIRQMTAKSLDALDRYIDTYDNPAATQADLDFAWWLYELALTHLGRAIQDKQDEANKERRTGKRAA